MKQHLCPSKRTHNASLAKNTNKIKNSTCSSFQTRDRRGSAITLWVRDKIYLNSVTHYLLNHWECVSCYLNGNTPFHPEMKIIMPHSLDSYRTSITHGKCLMNGSSDFHPPPLLRSSTRLGQDSMLIEIPQSLSNESGAYKGPPALSLQ